MDWVEEQIVIAVPVTLEYDPSRVGLAELVAHAERGLTNALQHVAGYYRIEGGKAALHQCLWGNDPSGPHYSDEYLASLPEPTTRAT